MISEHDLGHSETLNLTTTGDGDIVPIEDKPDEYGFTVYERYVSTRKDKPDTDQLMIDYQDPDGTKAAEKRAHDIAQAREGIQKVLDGANANTRARMRQAIDEARERPESPNQKADVLRLTKRLDDFNAKYPEVLDK